MLVEGVRPVDFVVVSGLFVGVIKPNALGCFNNNDDLVVGIPAIWWIVIHGFCYSQTSPFANDESC